MCKNKQSKRIGICNNVGIFCLVAGRNFHAGDLGPGTIVGSAAFNLFVIIGLCIYVIPSTEVRQVKHLRVFFVTATWSILAYVWLYLIIAQISPGVIEVITSHTSNTSLNDKSYTH